MNKKFHSSDSFVPLWYKQMAQRALPLTLGLFAAVSAFAAVPNASSETSGITVQQAKKQITVSGTVMSDEGEKLSGVSVTVPGTRQAVVTDAQGRYTIKVAPGSALQFSFIGYERQRVVATEGKLDVTLKLMDNSFNEAVVIGYGTVRKADLAGAVAAMDSKAFKAQPITRVSDALQGRVSGVQVIGSGIPGGSVKIRVRGTGSIHNSNEPLYVVDGVVRESGLDGINPEDIQSMQVLKDASSTAIYGSRGANGVVLITTKGGKAGQTQVVLDVSHGWAQATHMPKVMGTKEYAELLTKYKFNGNAPEDLKPFLNGTKPGVDWLDMVLRTGQTDDYKLSLSKGNNDTQLYVSAGYMKNSGVVVGTEFQRYSAKLNVHTQVYPWLELTADVQAVRNESKGSGMFGMNLDNAIVHALNYSPAMDMYQADGIKFRRDPYNSISAENPYAVLTAVKNDMMGHMVNGRFEMKFNLAKGLTFTSTNSGDYQDQKGYGFAPRVLSFGKTSMHNNDNFHLMLQSTNNLTYNQKWGEHSLVATAVYEATKSETRTMGISGQNLKTDAVEYWDVKNAAVRDQNNGYSAYALLSGVGRVMYNYADRYMLTATFRADGSSRFTNHKWGYFPSIAAAWSVTNEEFMQPLRKVVNNLKLRTSYGVIGNQNITPYSTLPLLSVSSFNFGSATDFTGYSVSTVATPNLTWEKTHQFDFGVDVSLWNNRIELGVDFFAKHTYDALLQRSQANYVGGLRYWVNAGEITNTGVDLSLTARIVQTNDFQWTSTINGSYNKNKVVKLTAEEPILYGNSPAGGTVDAVSIVKEGEAVGTFYGYVWEGIDKEGRDKYTDFNNNGKLDASDRRVLGKANPDFTLGWNNTLHFKQWELNAFFNAAFGAQRLNVARFLMNAMPGASAFVTDADYVKNMGVTMPRLDAVGNKNYGNSSKWVENADYLRLENISLAYNLTKEQTKFADVRLSFGVQNLFTLTGYKGADPAGFSFGRADYENGVDMGGYPAPRTFTLGARFTF